MKKILLVGSSIFEWWYNAASVAPGAAVINQAVSGTTTAYWVEHLANVLATESPDVVLFYCGSNDINNDVPDETIIANTFLCRAIIESWSETTVFGYFSIIKAPQKREHWERIDGLNETIDAGLMEGDLYVETNVVFFAESGPPAHFYVEDGLHLTTPAYSALSAYAEPLLVDWLRLPGGLQIPSPLVLGGHSFIPDLGNEPLQGLDEQLAIVDQCLDLGINCFDTTYEPERIALGHILEELDRRHEAQIIVWNFFIDADSGDHLGPPVPYTKSHLERILAQLHTDYIDRLVVHPVPDVAANVQQMAVARAWVDAGQVGLLGTWAPGANPIDTFGEENPLEFMVTPRNVGQPSTDSLRASKSLGWRTFATSPFNRGWLLDQLVDAADESTSPADERTRIADAMLRYSMHHPDVDHLIVGIRQRAWIELNLSSVARGPLSADEEQWLLDLYQEFSTSRRKLGSSF